jgi:hypothetical protein
MNLRSGNYYSTEGVASLLWGGIERGRTYPQLVELARTAFRPVPKNLTASIGPFIHELMAHEPIREVPTESAGPLSDESDQRK